MAFSVVKVQLTLRNTSSKSNLLSGTQLIYSKNNFGSTKLYKPNRYNRFINYWARAKINVVGERVQLRTEHDNEQ